MTPQIKHFAWFREFGLEDDVAASWPSLDSAIGRPAPTELDEITTYLENGALCVGTLDKVETDVLSGDGTPIAPLEILTDGEWVWPNLAVYYIRQHGLEVPDEFVEHMRGNEWAVPELSDETMSEISRSISGPVLDDDYFLSMLRASGWKTESQ